MKAVIWGVGTNCRNVLSNYHIPMEDIVCFVDSDEKKQNTVFCGKDVIAPDKLLEYDFDAVVLSPMSQGIRADINTWLCTHLGGYLSVLSIEEFAKEFITFSTKDVMTERAEYNKERKRLVDILMHTPPIDNRLLENAKLMSTRNDILKYMPKERVCAEIGVAYGDFTQEILNTMHPSIFYAIDYFQGGRGTHDFWGRTEIRDSKLTHQQWYERKFGQEIAQGKMKVLQGRSWEVLERFPDDFFDYVYLDADHSYDAVRKDVTVLYRKVKENGIIAFNDYNSFCMTIEPTRKDAYYGVPAVVNELIVRTKSEVLFLSLARHSSYDIVIRLNKENEGQKS